MRVAQFSASGAVAQLVSTPVRVRFPESNLRPTPSVRRRVFLLSDKSEPHDDIFDTHANILRARACLVPDRQSSANTGSATHLHLQAHQDDLRSAGRTKIYITV